MNRARHISLTLACLALFSFACDAGSGLDAELRGPEGEPRIAQVELTPAIDFSDVFDAEIADRVEIEEIIINVSDVRLLGLDPRIPTGGLPLIEQEQLIRVDENDGLARFPFPTSLTDDDLAIYVRITPSASLEEASVVVRGRFYEEQVPRHRYLTQQLSLDPDGEPADGRPVKNLDPDGEPADGRPVKSLDPDGEPADGRPEKNLDPDGEPADCGPDQLCRGLSAHQKAKSVPFELRGDQTVELQVLFGKDTRLDVVLAIPAARWFTPEAIRQLDHRIEVRAEGQTRETEQRAEEALVIEDQRLSQASEGHMDNDRIDGDRSADYELLNSGESNPGLRRD